MTFEPRPQRLRRLALGLDRSVSTSGGGGVGGVPISLPMTHAPRSTGDVRLPYEVRSSIGALAQQTPPPGIVERHAPELRAQHRGDAVVPREPLVQERVVGGEQVADVAILEQHARHEGLDLDGHVLPQLVVERRKQIRIGLHFAELVEIQPLEREVAHQARRARVVQHPKRLGLERARRRAACPRPRP